MSDNATTEVKPPVLSNSSYDVAKDATTIWIPAAAALYATIASILNLPYATEVIAIAGAITVFLGSVLKLSSKRFAAQPVEYNGTLVVNHTDPMAETHRLEIDQPWDELGKLNEVRIQVIDESAADPMHFNGKD